MQEPGLNLLSWPFAWPLHLTFKSSLNFLDTKTFPLSCTQAPKEKQKSHTLGTTYKALISSNKQSLSALRSCCLVPTDSSCVSLCLILSTHRHTGGSQLWKTEHKWRMTSGTWLASRDQIKLDLFHDLRAMCLPCFNRTASWHPFWELFQYWECWKGKKQTNNPQCRSH